jgi:hypothetical protein
VAGGKNRLGSDENNCQSLARTLTTPLVTPNSRRRFRCITVIFFPVAFVFLLFLGWLFSKEDNGTNRPIRTV